MKAVGMQLIIGAGEVGTALHQVLSQAHETKIRDLASMGRVKAQVLHVCFPWSEDFVQQVRAYAQEHEADLVVVHSTVPVGTCDPHGWVHSPVRGRHPHLAQSIRVFTKHLGGIRSREAGPVFRLADVPTKLHNRAAETEAGKLWELTQYGLSILVEKMIHGWCEDNKLNFDEVYTQFAETYNTGYTILGLKRVVRPVIEHHPGPIGGHCVTRGARLLDHDVSQLVADLGEETWDE